MPPDRPREEPAAGHRLPDCVAGGACPRPGQWALRRAYFPLVGLGLGGLLAGLDMSRPVRFCRCRWWAPCSIAALLVLTRAIHTEGFLDACDGLLGGQRPRVKAGDSSRLARRRVRRCWRREPLATEVDVAGRHTRPRNEPTVLVLFPCLSRFAMVITMGVFPYVRAQGLGTAFQVESNWRQLAFAIVTAAVAGGLLLGIAGLLLLVCATGLALGLGWWCRRMLGGMTGDTYGATNEVAEVTILLLGVILIRAAPILVDMLPSGRRHESMGTWYLVRHGETEWNRIGRMQGHIDSAAERLWSTVRPRSTCSATERHVEFDGDLQQRSRPRAAETARIIVAGDRRPVAVDSRPRPARILVR